MSDEKKNPTKEEIKALEEQMRDVLRQADEALALSGLITLWEIEKGKKDK